MGTILCEWPLCEYNKEEGERSFLESCQDTLEFVYLREDLEAV